MATPIAATGSTTYSAPTHRSARIDFAPPLPEESPAPTSGVVPSVYRTATTAHAILDRIVQSFAGPTCIDDRVVARWVRTYTRSPPRFRANLERSISLIALVGDAVYEAGLPGEFALLPIVESWYRPGALHGAGTGTAGLWQFTPATARNHGLQVTPAYDGRLAPAAATAAAVSYLQSLMERFGDWQLAAMAYNAGEYRLLNAHEADPARPQPQAHRPHGLALGTYEHLAKLHALACILAEPERVGVTLPHRRFEPLREVDLPEGVISLAQLTNLPGIDSESLQHLNRAYLHGRIAPDAPRRLLLPRSSAQALSALGGETLAAMLSATPSLPAIGGSGADSSAPRRHRVTRGESLWTIARRYGVALRDLLRWNGLDTRAVLQPGQELRLEP